MKINPVKNTKNTAKINFRAEKTKDKLELLRGLSEILEKTKGKPVSDNFWKKEAEALEKLHKENEKTKKSLQMTWETWTRPFDL